MISEECETHVPKKVTLKMLEIDAFGTYTKPVMVIQRAFIMVDPSLLIDTIDCIEDLDIDEDPITLKGDIQNEVELPNYIEDVD